MKRLQNCIPTIPAVWLGVCLSILLAFSGANAQNPESIGEIRRKAELQSIPLRITCSDARMQGMLVNMFSTHGAFRGPRAGETPAVLDFVAIGANGAQVAMEIPSSSGLRSSVRTAQGADTVEALLRAADMAVKEITGLPGYFAGKLAFISDRSGSPELYVSDLSFQKLSMPAPRRSVAQLPSFSPDGRKVVYTSYHAGNRPDIYEVDIALNSAPKRIAGYKGLNTGACYSPNGSTIAMILSGYGNAELAIANADGRNVRRLTKTRSLESDPSWSPDGRQIVFASDQTGNPQLYTITMGSGQVSKVPTGMRGYSAEPDWNPLNKNQIAFTTRAGREFEIALYDARTGESTIISSGPGDAVEPQWLNDGRHLIFTARTSTSRRICILDSLTGKVSPLHLERFGDSSQPAFVYLQ